MLRVSARLGQIFSWLMQAKEPISVDELAQRLKTSRRTVFREIENVEAVLHDYSLLIETRVGEGLVLCGPEEGRKRLETDLAANRQWYPANKAGRRVCIALMLLDAAETQKLYYYANAMGVSEATISQDLDVLEPWFQKYNISLIRRPGLGVAAEGEEQNLRHALEAQLLLARLPQHSLSASYGYPSAFTEQKVNELVENTLASQLDWMTDESRMMLGVLMMVAVERVRQRHLLTPVEQTAQGFPRQLADLVADSLEEEFSLCLPPPERGAIALGIRACRAKQKNPLGESEGEVFSRAQSLAFRMIESFDPSLAPLLKMNEQLVQGLSLHLWSAVVRIQRKIELPDPLDGQMQREYPELYQKSRRAAQVLQQELGLPPPESEVSFLSTHFGAALLHLGERGERRRVLRIGIVCVAGIGASYMLASQVRKRFKGEAEIDVSGWKDETDWESYDFLVSTIPLPDASRPVVLVPPLLQERDYEEIRRQIDAQVHRQTQRQTQGPQKGSLSDSLQKLQAQLQGAQALLEGFDVLAIHAGCSFEELAKLIGYRFGSTPQSGGEVFTDLTARERLSTQVVPGLGIALLHARTAGVQVPVLALVKPDADQFTHLQLGGVKSSVVMLVPQNNAGHCAAMMGHISSALIEDDAFLAAVQSGEKQNVYNRLERIIADYLNQFWMETLKG